MDSRARALLMAIAWLTGSAFAADVSTYAVIKNRSYDQTNATTTVLSGGLPFQFIAVVSAIGGNVTSASLLSPAGTNYVMTNTPGIGPLSISQLFADQTALDTVQPNGGFTFTIDTVNDGPQAPTLSLVGNAYPTAPLVANYLAAQAIRPESNFTVQWNPFVGGTANDNIVFNLRTQGGGSIFTTPVFGQPGALNGTATAVTIPAGTLATGGVYSATLSFAKVGAVNLTEYFGVPGVPVYSTSTDLRMRAISVPVLTITNTPAGAAQLRFNSDPGRAYDIRASSNLATWNSLAVTTAVGTTVIYLDTASPPLTNRFYRLQEP